MNFTPKQDFFSDATQSQYCAGLSYTARTPELTALVEQWETEGKVNVITTTAEISGKGA